ncbi:MAG: nucleotidyltransferase family protein [Burkholderiaceae bacterium]|nr:nucleotidyltransferase family protein [Microbacteriaceae bacterium]
MLLAAGAGTRYGGPKALVVHDGVGWLASGVALLLEAGCADVVVVLGASAEEAATLLPADPRVTVIIADAWRDGMAASLRAGLDAVAAGATSAVLVSLVDLPGLPVEAARRVLGAGGRESLRQAVYAGRPGHPVLIGRDHWARLDASLTGDSGARAYLAAHGAIAVECGDLGDGHDVDRAPDARGAAG